MDADEDGHASGWDQCIFFSLPSRTTRKKILLQMVCWFPAVQFSSLYSSKMHSVICQLSDFSWSTGTMPSHLTILFCSQRGVQKTRAIFLCSAAIAWVASGITTIHCFFYFAHRKNWSIKHNDFHFIKSSFSFAMKAKLTGTLCSWCKAAYCRRASWHDTQYCHLSV
jgi:hypothetical protein